MPRSPVSNSLTLLALSKLVTLNLFTVKLPAASLTNGAA
jgi:hypothetical protein